MFMALTKAHEPVNVALLLSVERAKAFFAEFPEHANADFMLKLVNAQPVCSIPSSELLSRFNPTVHCHSCSTTHAEFCHSCSIQV